MGKFVDMTGWVMAEHGVPDSRLTVIGRAEDYISPQGVKLIRWSCKCSCGSNKIIIATTHDLKSSHTRSCGCLRSESAADRGHKTWKKYNTYDLSGEYGVGYALNNQQFYFDLNDYDKIKHYCWCISSEGYVYAQDTARQTIVKLHRLIMNFPENLDIDHINHKMYDNRKENLRVCKHAENMMNQSKRSDNTSGVVGVNFHKQNGMWHARIGVHGKRINLGFFSNFNDAVNARKEAEDKYFGEYSYDNSVKEDRNEL